MRERERERENKWEINRNSGIELKIEMKMEIEIEIRGSYSLCESKGGVSRSKDLSAYLNRSSLKLMEHECK